MSDEDAQSFFFSIGHPFKFFIKRHQNVFGHPGHTLNLKHTKIIALDNKTSHLICIVVVFSMGKFSGKLFVELY